MRQPKPLPKKLRRWLEAAAVGGACARDFSERDAQAVLDALEYAKRYMDRVQVAGQLLSNAAFNLSQREGHTLDANETRALRDGYEKWDAAVRSGERYAQKVRPLAAPTTMHPWRRM
jgi:hypothetical protein